MTECAGNSFFFRNHLIILILNSKDSPRVYSTLVALTLRAISTLYYDLELDNRNFKIY